LGMGQHGIGGPRFPIARNRNDGLIRFGIARPTPPPNPGRASNDGTRRRVAIRKGFRKI
jgi:hypothetical protein